MFNGDRFTKEIRADAFFVALFALFRTKPGRNENYYLKTYIL